VHIDRDMVRASVVDPHHYDTDPDRTYHPDADPDPDPSFEKRFKPLKGKIGPYSIHFGSTSAK
jgi:hypothetical protein